MAKITFITRDNKRILIEGSSGTLMKLAKNNGVKGIDGECGGVCSCATCHVHVKADFFDKTGPASETEADLLELNEHTNEYSRLCCQIQISDKIDGMEVRVAEKSSY